ncbi:pentatricopeptide repeat-containing protein At4g33170-like [Papaver somniferum]|uniref:pentatricopeptide repeat-containing protein At4g33170-like n=1 Tax=Papaver somniferum TaxID=3469 RepID=UPI000E700D59|nr:pentatricopeptide repeat-containing protein At4g33170-like [Papaver somniferum]
MQKSGVKSDAITFVVVLDAFSHTWVVHEGYSHFDSMLMVYGLWHMLGRAGKITKAEELIEDMPMKPDYFVPSDLLGSCRSHGDGLNPISSKIYKMLEDMISRLKIAGYVPDKPEVLFDVDEEEKALSLHFRQKLAISFGLKSTSPGTQTVFMTSRIMGCGHAKISGNVNAVFTFFANNSLLSISIAS